MKHQRILDGVPFRVLVLAVLAFAVLGFVVLALASCAGGGTDTDDPYADSGADMSGAADDLATPTAIPTSAAVARPTFKVLRGDIVEQLIISGRVAPVRQAELFFRTNGRIKSVFVKSGEMVKAGQVIAELEMDELERDLAGSRLDLEQAQAKLKSRRDEIARNAKEAQLNLEIAHENLAIVKTQDPAPRKAKAEAELQQASLARQRAKKNYDALPAGPERDASPEAASLQQAAAGYTIAKAALDSVLQEVEAFGHRVVVAERQVDLAQLAVDSLAGEADPLLANDAERARFAVDKLQAGLADAQIVAPYEGEVQISFGLSPGSAAEAYRYLASVSDISELDITGDVANVPLSRVAVGMPAIVSPVAQPGVDLKARIRQVPKLGVLTEGGQGKDLRFELEDADQMAGLRNGDLVRITLVLQEQPGVLWLPPQAIRTFEGRKFVVVQDEGAAAGTGQRRVDVELGIQTEARVEILDGLTEGQTVVAP